MKDSRATRTSKLPQYLVKRSSQKVVPIEEKKRSDESMKVWNVYDGDEPA